MEVNTIIHADCLDALREMPENCIDSIVTDPPYGLSFMGKRWDYDVPSVDIWRECLRVLKPGGHMLAFAGTRTQHRMAANIEDAGFEIRDMILWLYGSGFPKSLDVGKAIDKMKGAEREVVGVNDNHRKMMGTTTHGDNFQPHTSDGNITAPATPEAKQWDGWGTALKPACEPITVARKPLIGTVAENVLTHGTGGINIDGCRVGTEIVGWNGLTSKIDKRTSYGMRGTGEATSAIGRFPANVIHDGSPEVVAGFPETVSGSWNGQPRSKSSNIDYSASGSPIYWNGDSGSAARFFYVPKADKRDRDEGCEELEEREAGIKNDSGRGFSETDPMAKIMRRNHHPTVKPTDLIRYLCRLVTPPGGIVLDPFAGSGTTGKAAFMEGFKFILIERDAEYVNIAQARIDSEMSQGRLF